MSNIKINKIITNSTASYNTNSLQSKTVNNFTTNKYAPEKRFLSSFLIPVIPKNFIEPCKFVSVPLHKPAALIKVTPQEQGKAKHLELWQRQILVDFFEKTSQSPTNEEIKKLSQKVKRSDGCVQRWFYNKRRIVKGNKIQKLINHDQLKTLEIFFYRNQNPTVEEMEKLGEDLELSVIRVNSWFYNRRYKAKKESKSNSSIAKEKRKVSNRRNVNYTDEEKRALEAEYEKNKHPSLEDKQKISEKLELDVLRVHFWFQSRRSKRYSSKDDDSSRNEPGPSSSSMMNKGTGTTTLFPVSGNQTFNRSEESLVSRYRHKPSANEEPRQQTVMSSSENKESISGENDFFSSQSKYEKKQSFNVENGFNLENTTQESSTNIYLNKYNNEDEFNRDTTLFPELFEEPVSSLHQEEHDYMQYINKEKF